MNLIGLVHTTHLVLNPVHDAICSKLQDIQVNHVLDEGILRRLATLGSIQPEIVDWLTRMVKSAQEVGSNAVVVSCSSLSPCVNEVRRRVDIPVLKVDEPMIEFAVGNGDRIGLVMTNPTTEVPSQLLFKEVAERLGRTVQLVPKLCPEAFARLSSGDVAGHDRQVLRTVEEMLHDVDLVMLAQISIARVKATLSDDIRPRVLSSLDFIADRVQEILDGRGEQ